MINTTLLRASRALPNSLCSFNHMQSNSYGGGLSETDVVKGFLKTSAMGATLIGMGVLCPESIGVGVLSGTGLVSANILAQKVIFPYNGVPGQDALNYTIQNVLKPSSACIRAPVVEEIAYRYLLQDQILTPLIDMMSLPISTSLTATVAASVVFGAVHLANGNDPLFKRQSIGAFFGGLALGSLYNEYGLLTAISAHAANNTVGTLLNTLNARPDR